MPSTLQAIWYRQRRPPVALRVLARAFGLLVQLRCQSYQRGLLPRRRVNRPVIVVGNITVGGSGKTPLVIWLCEQLHTLGLSSGVVLRGYGGSAAWGREPHLVGPSSDAAVVGDEAVLLARRTRVPVAVCRNRARAAQRLVAEGVDVIVSDDGLQHLAMARDFEVAVIDTGRRLGNGYLLPAGPLREPPERLSRLDAVVLNVDGSLDGGSDGSGADPAVATSSDRGVQAQGPLTAARALTPGSGAAFVMRLTGELLWPLTGRGAPVALTSLAGGRVHAVAGIGHPERFFARLAAAGLQVIAHPFPDHHRYRARELDFGDELPLLMTEKDAVKCADFEAANRWFLPVAASFAEAEAAALMARLKARIAARLP